MKTKVSGGATTTYGWDYESNLLSIDYPGTSNDDSHEYDGDGRRMRSKFNGAANWTNYVWDEVAGTLLAEYTLISGTYTLKSENSWGLGLISTNRESTKRYFHFDGMGNTVALTDGSENITDTLGYTSTGSSVAADDSGTSVNPFRWLGRNGAYSDGAMGSVASLITTISFVFSPSLYLIMSSPISNISLGISHHSNFFPVSSLLVNLFVVPQSGLNDPFTKAMCRAICLKLADANDDGVIGPIERKRIYEPCLLACERVGAKGTKRMWCKGIESTIDH